MACSGRGNSIDCMEEGGSTAVFGSKLKLAGRRPLLRRLTDKELRTRLSVRCRCRPTLLQLRRRTLRGFRFRR